MKKYLSIVLALALVSGILSGRLCDAHCLRG